MNRSNRLSPYDGFMRTKSWQHACAAAVPLLILLTGCGPAGTNSAGYIPGDGNVREYKDSARSEPLSLSGRSLEGKPLSLAAMRGKPVVINLWGAWCAVCVKEAPTLQKAHEQIGSSAEFVGIDLRDFSADNAKAFERGNHITYPSIYSPDGSALKAFSGYLSVLSSTPSTLVLDSKGRVASVIGGPVPSVLTLVELVQEASHTQPAG